MKLTDLQLSQVDAQIKRLIQTDSYYGRIYKEAVRYSRQTICTNPLVT